MRSVLYQLVPDLEIYWRCYATNLFYFHSWQWHYAKAFNKMYHIYDDVVLVRTSSRIDTVELV